VVSAGRNGERLQLQSEECDAVLSTWTLCTIPNLTAALGDAPRAETRRSEGEPKPFGYTFEGQAIKR
jgi:hypothetical protein